MRLKTYQLGYKGALEKLQIQKYTILLLAGAIVLLSFNAVSTHERLVIMPPVFDEQIELGYQSANRSYHEAFALYVASFLGNINPSNANFVKEGLSLSFSPELYNEMQSRISDDAERMRSSGRSLRFYADRVVYEEGTGKTFVAGKQEIVSAAGNVHDQDVTYEMHVAIRDGLPKVEKYAFYTGAPRTQEWLRRNRNTPAGAEAAAAAGITNDG